MISNSCVTQLPVVEIDIEQDNQFLVLWYQSFFFQWLMADQMLPYKVRCDERSLHAQLQ
jgi:hypothetical protein